MTYESVKKKIQIKEFRTRIDFIIFVSTYNEIKTLEI